MADAPNAAAAAAPATGGKKKNMIAMLAVVLLLVGGAVTVGIVAFPSSPAGPAGEAAEEEHEEAKGPLTSVLMPLPQILVNLTDSNGSRLLQSTWTIELLTDDEAKTQEQFTKYLPKVQAQMIKLLSSYRVIDLEGGANKEFLQVRLKDHLNESVFAKEKVKVGEVYFTEFVIQ